MTKPEYVLIKFRENPDFRFYDIYTPNKILVESCDQETLSNAEVADKLQNAFDNLSGTYIVKLRTKSRSKLSAGGDVKGTISEYTVNIGGQTASANNSGQISGIGYLEQVYSGKAELEALKFNHRMDLFLKDQEIKALQDKLKAKVPKETGFNETDKMIGLAIAKNLGVDVSMFMPSAPVPISSAVNGPPTNTDNETRVINAVDNLAAINPDGFIDLLENITNTLKHNPDKIAQINSFFAKTGAGESLVSSLMGLMS
jgi:hypothetical protein